MSEAGPEQPKPSVAPQAAAAEPPRGDARARMYRREALDYHVGARHEPHLLELSPGWTNRAYWVVLGVCCFALFFVSVSQIREYASGQAIIHIGGRTYVTARSAGTVEEVLVKPGQRVQSRQVLMRLYAKGEEAELQRTERELELHLIKLLRNLEDEVTRSALTSLRAQRERAQALLEERTIYATGAGVVSDVRAYPGQELAVGDILLSLADESQAAYVTAVVSGQHRPLLRPGMPMRLEMQGYPYAYVTVTIDSVADDIVSPSEARRYLRQSNADIVVGKDPVVFVTAVLPRLSFSIGERELKFHDGMQASAEIAVRSESLLLSLVPGLRSLWGTRPHE